MKIVNLILRILLGLMLIVFGLNKFLMFMPMEMSPEVETGMAGLMTLGYLMPLVALVEILTGVALLLNKFKSLMLIIMMPVSINIVLFHLALEPSTVAGGLFVLIVNFYLLLIDKDKFVEILKP